MPKSTWMLSVILTRDSHPKTEEEVKNAFDSYYRKEYEAGRISKFLPFKAPSQENQTVEE